MKLFYYLLPIILFSACGNKKAEIVEEIKETKNKLIEAQMTNRSYSYAASKLLAYNISLADSKKYGSQQMKENAQIYKESYERAIQDLKGVAPEILKSQKKLDSIAFIWEMQAKTYSSRIDSLELELKKY